jgi:hypothetical protein
MYELHNLGLSKAILWSSERFVRAISIASHHALSIACG